MEKPEQISNSKRVVEFIRSKAKPQALTDICDSLNLGNACVRSILLRLQEETLTTSEDVTLVGTRGKGGRRNLRVWSMTDQQYEAYLRFLNQDPTFVSRQTTKKFVEQLKVEPPANLTTKIQVLGKVIESSTMFKDNPILKDVLADYKKHLENIDAS